MIAKIRRIAADRGAKGALSDLFAVAAGIATVAMIPPAFLAIDSLMEIAR